MRVQLFCVALLFGTALGGEKKATASHILMAQEDKLEEVKKRIVEEGADFAAEAKEHSTCPSGKKGGSLGSFGPGAMVPEFDKVVFDPKTELNQVVGPVKTQFGYHLIKVTEREGVAAKKGGKKKKKDKNVNEKLTTEGEFKEKVLESKDIFAVEFYSDRCGSCQEFAPVWNAYAADAPIRTAKMNIDDSVSMKLAQSLGVMDEGIPNVRLFTGAPEHPDGVSIVKGDTVSGAELKKKVEAELKGFKKKSKKTGYYRKVKGDEEL